MENGNLIACPSEFCGITITYFAVALFGTVASLVVLFLGIKQKIKNSVYFIYGLNIFLMLAMFILSGFLAKWANFYRDLKDQYSGYYGNNETLLRFTVCLSFTCALGFLEGVLCIAESLFLRKQCLE